MHRGCLRCAAACAALLTGVAACSGSGTKAAQTAVTIVPTAAEASTAAPSPTLDAPIPIAPEPTIAAPPSGPASIAPTSPAAAAATTRAAVPPAPAPSSRAPAGCPATTGSIPAGATSGASLDVDGDGRDDTQFVGKQDSMSNQLFGLSTASGATFSSTYGNANRSTRLLFVLQVAGQTVAVMNASGRSSEAFIVTGCSLVPVTNADGTEFDFSDAVAGPGGGMDAAGYGIACATLPGAGGPSLVGIHSYYSQYGQLQKIVKNQVVITGHVAMVTGSSTNNAPTDADVKEAQSISCAAGAISSSTVEPDPSS